jgi:hypothetical protein
VLRTCQDPLVVAWVGLGLGEDTDGVGCFGVGEDELVDL